MKNANCIDCDAIIELDDDVVLGELVQCPECGMELEVTGIDPLTLEEAPDVEEDWGE